MRVHGVNMSVGYDFDPKWFACGQSPLCVEVDRLVRSGVVVVVAAGNTGYGFTRRLQRGPAAAGLDLTINDPGNAELAITVGSTHRDMPHIYGVSYFSSKGPTGDGRLKPDLVAPGEKIISCASSQAAQRSRATLNAGGRRRADRSGVLHARTAAPAWPRRTSPAPSRRSSRSAASSSASPKRVKEIFLSTRDRPEARAVYFQGKGLVDLMRAIQSV